MSHLEEYRDKVSTLAVAAMDQSSTTVQVARFVEDVLIPQALETLAGDRSPQAESIKAQLEIAKDALFEAQFTLMLVGQNCDTICRNL